MATSGMTITMATVDDLSAIPEELRFHEILDPESRRLRVHRWAPPGYAVVLEASAGERVRAEPFDALELSVLGLFDDDEAEA